MSSAYKKMLIVLTAMLAVAVGVAFGLTGIVSPVFAQQSGVTNASSNPPAAAATVAPATSNQPVQAANSNSNPPSQSGNTGRGSQSNNGGSRGSNTNNGGGRRGFVRVQLNWQVVATALGLNETDLYGKLNNGETLTQLASEQNVDAQKVQNAILSDVKSQLSQAVQNGQIMQAQSDQLYQRYSFQVQQMMDQPLN